MGRKGLAAAAVGSLLGGAALFELISPAPSSKMNLGGVTIQSQPNGLAISSEAAFVQCLLTLNRKFTAFAKLAPGETLVPWSHFVAGQDVHFDPAVVGPDVLMIECLKPVHGVGVFRLR